MSQEEHDINISQPSIEESYSNVSVLFEHESAEIIGYHRCGMPRSLLESVDIWLHEFLEMFLWKKPHMQDPISDKRGNIKCVAHVVAAICHCATVQGKIIPGDEIWERFFVG